MTSASHDVQRPAGSVVLAVDDEVVIRQSLQRFLSGAGYQVLTAPSLNEARRMELGGPIDLLLVDLLLADGNGLELAREHVRVHPEAPWILFSGRLTDDVEEEAWRLNAAAVLRKPVRFKIVLAAVRAALRRRGIGTVICLDEGPHERVARFIAAGIGCAIDPRVSSLLAREAGASLGTFRETCRLAAIRPRDARDIARGLRARDRADGEIGRLKQFLNVRDERTSWDLLDRMGVDKLPIGRSVTALDMLRAQRLIPIDHPVVQALVKRMTS